MSSHYCTHNTVNTRKVPSQDPCRLQKPSESWKHTLQFKLPSHPRRHRLRVNPQALFRRLCFPLYPLQYRIPWAYFRYQQHQSSLTSSLLRLLPIGDKHIGNGPPILVLAECLKGVPSHRRDQRRRSWPPGHKLGLSRSSRCNWGGYVQGVGCVGLPGYRRRGRQSQDLNSRQCPA